MVTCAAYAGGRRVADVALDEIHEVLGREDGFVWIGLYEPDEALLRVVQREFGLHDLAIEDAHRAHQRPKLEQYPDSLFVVLRTARLAAGHAAGHAEGEAAVDGRPGVAFGETHVFVGRHYVVTVRHGSQRAYTALRARCEAAPALLAKGPGFVLYALMDFLVDQYFPVVAALEEDVARLEEQLIGDTDRPVSRTTLARIYRLKRDLLAVKRAVAPLVEVCTRLTRFDLALIPEDTRPYFRDVFDHVIRVNEMVDNLRELLTTAFEVNLSLISVEENREMKRLAEVAVEQNRDTRRLAAWAAIIAVPTMLAGIYGMNFQLMPELSWWFGYPLALAVMGAACSALYWGFKRSGWL
ncbi:MAG TPA: magnesium and cobalt transport protein CorA [Thermomonospora sp.]|nr:magnesium and cobalt transport protein CorA [Thermomonospora sp.]